MNFIGNIIWLLIGGIIAAILWALSGLLLCLTIIGIPFGLQCFKIAGFVLWPPGYGRTNGYPPGPDPRNTETV
jgi:uncharacterized membrane protein YccF (DUF307 family)